MRAWIRHKISRLKVEAARAVMLRAISGIRSTAPIALADDGPTIVSMLGHREIALYLLSLKSFTQYCSPARVVILNDGSLSPADLDLLARHIPGLTVKTMAEVNRGTCQQGGCWERLCLIGALTADSFVIQLDSDMLTIRRPELVLRLIADQRCFTMPGDLTDEPITSELEAARKAAATPGDFFQLRFERALDRLPDADTRPYLRGCAALAGFAPGSVTLGKIEAVHSRYLRLVGSAEWHHWGSEQIASNVLIAAEPNAVVLPSRDYCSHFGSETPFDYAASAMIHFIGVCRYDNGTYRRLAVQTLKRMK